MNKLIPLLLLLWCSSIGRAQSIQLPGKWSYAVEQVSLSTALEQLEETTSYSFAYSPAKIPFSLQAKSFSCSMKAATLDDILQELFSPYRVEWKEVAGQIVLRRFILSTPTHTLSGYLRDATTGEALIGGTIVRQSIPEEGTAANAYGYYALQIEAGYQELLVEYLGYDAQLITVNLSSDQRLDIQLLPASTALTEVVVTAQAKTTTQTLSSHVINVDELKYLPALAGEADVLKMAQMLPGVKTVGEGATGFFVRGGNMDQNLILLDEAVVYNPSHLLGFFSAFNTDAIRHTELYKGYFPAQYGGRLSSVMDLRMKEGNKEHLSVSGGIGLLASRLLVEGPVQKKRSSYMLAARRTYPDIFLALQSDNGGNKINFYDLNAKVNVAVNKNNHLYLSGYLGNDVFRFFDQYENHWGNTTATLRWNHLFGPRLFSNTSLIFSHYDYDIQNFIEGITTFNWSSAVDNQTVKGDFTYLLADNDELRFGIQAQRQAFDPGSNTEGQLLSVPAANTITYSAYIQHHWQASPQLAIRYGLRANYYQRQGPATIYSFNEQGRLQDSMSYDKGVYFTSFDLAPRLLLEYRLRHNARLELSYNRSYQYQQELRNAVTAFNAFYIWMPSGPNVPVQKADQVALGFRKRIDEDWEWSVETYYKWLQEQIDFADHAVLLQNPYLEGELRQGSGHAYGVEWMLRKHNGRLKGWVSYAYARSLRTISGVNDNLEYPTFYDQPHEAELVLQYELSGRCELAAHWQYNTGQAVNLPIGSYQYEGTVVPIYGARNSQRLPDFHRLDLSLTLRRKGHRTYRNDSYWVFSVQNAYYRKNALSVDLAPRRDAATGNVPDPNDVIATKTYIFGLIPSVAYNFKF